MEELILFSEAHPFDLDAFIDDVHEEFKGTEFEESKDALLKVWNSILSMTGEGDVSLYPGVHRKAAMKVWWKASDYWERGFKLGDILPDRMPRTDITRTADGWIY